MDGRGESGRVGEVVRERERVRERRLVISLGK